MLSQGDGVVIGKCCLTDAGTDVLIHQRASQIGHVHLNGGNNGCVLMYDFVGPGVCLVGVDKLGIVVLVTGQRGEQLVVAVDEVLVAAVFHNHLVEGQLNGLQSFLVSALEGALIVGGVCLQLNDNLGRGGFGAQIGCLGFNGGTGIIQLDQFAHGQRRNIVAAGIGANLHKADGTKLVDGFGDGGAGNAQLLGNVVDVQLGGRDQIQRYDFVKQQIGHNVPQLGKGVFIQMFLKQLLIHNGLLWHK